MRKPRLSADFRIRRADSPEFSGRETLAAASSRLRCVLADGCPVLKVHFSFGLAPHMGQRTDNIWSSVSFSGFTAILFNIANRRDVRSCFWVFNQLRNGNLTGADQCPWIFSRGGMPSLSRGNNIMCKFLRCKSWMPGFHSAPRPPSLVVAEVRRCNEAACWLIMAAAWVRRLPFAMLKSSVVTLCSQKVHLKVVPPFSGLVV
jgi:hypothetical protein